MERLYHYTVEEMGLMQSSNELVYVSAKEQQSITIMRSTSGFDSEDTIQHHGKLVQEDGPGAGLWQLEHLYSR